MKRILIAFIFIIIFSCVYADGGMTFLIIDTDPSTQAMGEISAFSRNVAKNPANSVNANNLFLSAYHTEYLMSTRFDELGIIIPAQFGNLHFNAKGFYTDPMSTFSSTVPDSVYSFTYINALITAGYAKSFGNLSAGVNAKFLYSSADTFNAAGVLFDIGADYRPVEKLSIGLTINDLGPEIKYADFGIMPAYLRASIGYKVIDALKVAADFDFSFNRANMFEAGAGIEYSINNVLFLRAGYIYNSMRDNMLDNIRAGLGFNLGPVGVGYSIANYNDLGLTHTVGITYNQEMAEKRKGKAQELIYAEMEKRLEDKEKMMSDMFYNKSKSYFADKRYEDALEQVDLSLIWYPNNTNAEDFRDIIATAKAQYEIDKEIDKGIESYMAGDYLDAVRIFKAVLEKDPGNDKARKYMDKAQDEQTKSTKLSAVKDKLESGISLYTAGKFIEARKVFEDLGKSGDLKAKEYLTAVEQKINDLVNTGISSIESEYAKKNYVYVIKKSNEYLKYGVRTDKLNQLKNDAEKKKNEQVSTLLTQAKTSFTQKDYKKAEELFRKVMVVDSSNTEAQGYLDRIKTMDVYSVEDIEDLYLKGIESYTNNDYRMAVKFWEKCLEIKPDYEKAVKNIEKAKKKIAELENN